jgi:flagellar protein FlbT
MTEFMGAVRNPDVLTECVSISREVMQSEFYKALVRCRKLMDYEAERLRDVLPSLSVGSTARGDAA